MTNDGLGFPDLPDKPPGEVHDFECHGAICTRLFRITNELFRQELPQHVLQDPAVTEIALLLGRVDPHGHRELLVVGAHRQLAGNLVGIGQTGDRERLLARQTQRLGRVAVLELQWKDAHADQV